MNECKKQSLSAFAFSSTLPFMLLCSCVTQSALPSVSFTLLCPTPCLAPHNALPSSLLVVRPALPSALCAVRYALCIFLRCAVSCSTLSYPAQPHTLPCPALPCPTLPCPALPSPALSCLVLPYPACLPCPVLSCTVLSCPVLSFPALHCPILSRPEYEAWRDKIGRNRV